MFFKPLALVLLVLHLSCNLSVNTTDPQASKSIAASVERKVFIRKFVPDQSHHSCIVSEAWIEKVWRNVDEGVTTGVEVFQTIQLVLVFNWKEFPLDLNKYFIEWEISDSTFGKFGTGNGVFILSLGKNEVPSYFNVDVIKRDSSKAKVCEIHLVPSVK